MVWTYCGFDEPFLFCYIQLICSHTHVLVSLSVTLTIFEPNVRVRDISLYYMYIYYIPHMMSSLLNIVWLCFVNDIVIPLVRGIIYKTITNFINHMFVLINLSIY